LLTASSTFISIFLSHDSNINGSSKFCFIVDLNLVLINFNLEKDRSLEADVAGIVHANLYAVYKFENADIKLYELVNLI
jgi:hypothetical protein